MVKTQVRIDERPYYLALARERYGAIPEDVCLAILSGSLFAVRFENGDDKFENINLYTGVSPEGDQVKYAYSKGHNLLIVCL